MFLLRSKVHKQASSAVAAPNLPHTRPNQGLNAPAGHLPADLLYIISTTLLSEPVLLRTDSMLVVSQVCLLWRSVALDYPTLWSLIRTFSPTLVKNVWLPRSRDTSLCITLTFPRGPAGPGAASLMATLNGAAHRLKEINLRECRHDLAVALLRPPPIPFAELETLSIQLTSRDPHLTTPQLTHQFMPNIKTLYICACLLSFDPAGLSIWGHSLREIRLNLPRAGAPWDDDELRLSGVYGLLQHTSHTLESFWLWAEGKNLSPSDPLPNRIIHLPKLTELSLGHSGGTPLICDHLLPLLNLIHAPFVRDSGVVQVSALPIMARDNPLPGLQDLRLKAPPAIADFNATFAPYRFSFFDALSHINSRQSVSFLAVDWVESEYAVTLSKCCPELVEISFYSCNGIFVKDLKALVVNRRGETSGLAAIKKITIRTCLWLIIDADDEAWFEAHLEQWSSPPIPRYY